jgi:hypothetical protein
VPVGAGALETDWCSGPPPVVPVDVQPAITTPSTPANRTATILVTTLVIELVIMIPRVDFGG